MGLQAEKLDNMLKPAIHSMIKDLLKKKEFEDLLHLAAGGIHTLVINSAGNIRSWGINNNPTLG
jgi:regulator of chromosome condensation